MSAPGASVAGASAAAPPQPPAVSPPRSTAGSSADVSSPEPDWVPFLTEAQRFEREGNYLDAQAQYEVVVIAKT